MIVKTTPRIGYVLKVYPRYSETFVVNEILAHEAASMPVEIFSLRQSGDGIFHESLARVRSPVTYIPKPSGKASDFWNTLRRTVKEWPDIMAESEMCQDVSASDVEQALLLAHAVREHGLVHLHAHFGTLATSVARLAAKIAGVSYSFTAHAKDIFHGAVEQDKLRRKLADAAVVITVSQYNLEYLRSTYGSAARRVELVYNGLDLSDFLFETPQERPPLILGVGRLVEKKGFEYLIKACDVLHRSGVSFQCEIVGMGVLNKNLKSHIAELNLQDCVTLTGPLPQGEVRKKLRHASVLAAPCVIASDSDRDGLPTILLEAMALGTPCVSTDVTGIPEVLHHERTGLAVAQRDPVELANACSRLLSDPTLRIRLATNARRLIETKFDVQKNTRKLRRVIHDAADWTGTDSKSQAQDEAVGMPY